MKWRRYRDRQDSRENGCCRYRGHGREREEMVETKYIFFWRREVVEIEDIVESVEMYRQKR